MSMNATEIARGLAQVERGDPPPKIASPIDARWYRNIAIGLLAIAVLAPVGLIVYQSFLDGPFFSPRSSVSLEAYRYVLTDPTFWIALRTTTIFAFGMVFVAVPLGGILAFLLTRTDIRFKRTLEILVLVPMFISSIVLAFGYTVSVGPSGFLTIWFRELFGGVPWNLYSLPGIILIAGLSHVPHVYLYVSAAMRNLPSDLEEAARTSGASIWQVSRDVTLPMVLPALIFAAALNLLLGFETFGIPLVLGDPNGILVLTTYIYKLTTLFGVPTYQLMAVVAMVLILITLPLVFFQRRLLRNSRRYAALGGKGARATPLKLGGNGQVIALTGIAIWLLVSVALPIGGISVRAFVSAWGQGIDLLDYVTLANFDRLLEVPSLSRGIVNTLLLSVVGGAAAVFIYLLVGLAGHRNHGTSNTVLDYIVLLPRALPGLVIGLAFFWVFLFVPFLTPLRPTLVALFIAYMVVGLSYGLRLLQGTLIQVSPELEEAARTSGATIGRTWRDIVIPIVRPGLAGAWALIMIIFLREYATGVYLMGAGTEVIGSLMVTLLQTGAMDTIAALAFISIIMTAAGLTLALRLGAKIHD
ncbi:iron ABC transporter permease [Fulvimarina sp. 2208YS6-2-32]|uniref:Iron ABC transporter permease n=1 Tax=Fulvimarina uroteuthidis TaxID=3098149 RepID=A0ABU5I6W7_9HYPH|nr:iron ABC transporter permease [Fulvimarina sp. 2208YS6-2-32]MDY8109881.1 iron ABC transporter permease [Fulvimarina sp. 2208YS6-2-32]